MHPTKDIIFLQILWHLIKVDSQPTKNFQKLHSLQPNPLFPFVLFWTHHYHHNRTWYGIVFQTLWYDYFQTHTWISLSTEPCSWFQRVRRYMERVHGKAVKETYRAGLEDYLYFILSIADENKDGSVSRWL